MFRSRIPALDSTLSDYIDPKMRSSIPADSRCMNVVLIEDDPDIREAITNALQWEGYEVFEAANGSIGMEVLRKSGNTCLVLLDLMMPVMDGWEFLAAKQADPAIAGVPVIIMSAVASENSCVGAAVILKKPIDLDILLANVKLYCGTRLIVDPVK